MLTLRKSVVPVCLLLVLGSACRQARAQVTITFPDFSSSAGLTLNGNAHLVNNALRLTDAAFFQSGSAFSTTTIPLNSQESFSSAFSFRISSPTFGIGDEDGLGADGLAFVVQTVANNVGGAGGGIGYAGLSPSVGIEFDTFNNGGGDGNNGNHVGIDLNGDVSSFALKPAPTGPNNSTRFNNAGVWYAWVDYNGAADDLEVRYSDTNVRPTDPFLTADVNLATILGTPNAFAGFTSGTGSGVGDHDILSWTFINQFSPIGGSTVPEPSTVALLIGVLGASGMLAVRCRRRK